MFTTDVCVIVLRAIYQALQNEGGTESIRRMTVSDVGDDEFIIALNNLQKQGLIKGTVMIYGGDGPDPIEAIWDEILLTDRGLTKAQGLM
ncbi:hypothetical protein [Paenibacillus validus]|uniref:hypothetical protein n=1 Tax=Paenibacillus validus TaxID=44253 RepID=UPI003D2A30DB